jgi:hypothetical protein
MGTGSTERWREGAAPRGRRTARWVAGDAPAPAGAAEAASRPDRAPLKLLRRVRGDQSRSSNRFAAAGRPLPRRRGMTFQVGGDQGRRQTRARRTFPTLVKFG